MTNKENKLEEVNKIAFEAVMAENWDDLDDMSAEKACWENGGKALTDKFYIIEKVGIKDKLSDILANFDKACLYGAGDIDEGIGAIISMMEKSNV